MMKSVALVVFASLAAWGCSSSGVVVENRGSGNVKLVNGDVRKVINQVPPEYPHSLRARRIAGVVVVRLWVRPDGTVSAAEVRYTPHPELAPLALAAVEKWRLEPAPPGDQKTIVLETPVEFQIQAEPKK